MDNSIFYGLETVGENNILVLFVKKAKKSRQKNRKRNTHNPFLSNEKFINFLTSDSLNLLQNLDKQSKTYLIEILSERFEKRLGNSFRLMEKVFYTRKGLNIENFYAAYSIALYHPSKKISSIAFKYFKKFVKNKRQGRIFVDIIKTLFENETLEDRMKSLMKEKLGIEIEEKRLTA